MSRNTPQFARREYPRRGSVVIIVLWSIALAAIITGSVQLFGMRQASLGREAVERVQARWAARAGMEYAMEVMADHTREPRENDAMAMVRDLWHVSGGELLNASYNIMHHIDGREYGGPMDEHAKLNLNRADDRALLLVLDDVTLDLLDAIGDWIDEDNDVSTLGVERDYYRSLDGPYEPRNGPLQSLAEVELIAGIWPKHFRGEDWNLNNRLDPNENDGSRSFPPDQPDALLDSAWSGRLTVYSVIGGATMSGQPRIHLRKATVKELKERLGVDDAQAEALISFGQNSSNSLSDLLFNPLTGGNQNNQQAQQQQPQQQQQGRGGQSQVQPEEQDTGNTVDLTDRQLRAILAECSIEDPLDRKPGKMNINTVPSQFFRDIIDLLGLDEAIADEILFMRSGRPEGITSLVDLQKIAGVTPEDLRAITSRFDVVSNVYTISSRGRSAASGLEVEIIAVVDRSTVPVQIIEYREQ